MFSSYILRLFIFSWLVISDKSLVWVTLRGSLVIELYLLIPKHSLKEENGTPCLTLSLPEGLQPRSNGGAGFPTRIRCPASVRDHVTLHP